MMSLREVKSIARKIRKAFEEIEKKEGSYGDVPGDLGGYCGRASVQLYLACRRKGIKVVMAEGEGHMFNVYNGRIIDVTATQFGVPEKIFVRKLSYGDKLNRWGGRLTPCYHTPYELHKTAKSAERVFSNGTDTIRDKRVVKRYLKD